MKFWKSLGIAALVSSLIPYACERDEDGARTYTALLYKLKRRADPEAEDKHLVDLELGLNNPFARSGELADIADADPFGDDEPVLHVIRNAAEKAEDAAEDLMEKAQPYVEKVCDAAQPYAEKARDAAEDLVEKAQPYVEKVCDAAQPYVDKARDAAQDLAGKAQPYVEDAADKAFEAANHAANLVKDAFEKKD